MSLIKYLTSNSEEDANQNRPDALVDLRTVFSSDEWGLEPDLSVYTDSNKKNIWKNELRKPLRRMLSEEGLGEDQFSDWLDGIHYASVDIYLKDLFHDGFRSNAGWRVLLLSIPKAKSVVIGLASHYQNAQNHGRLGDASNLMFDVISESLESSSDVMMAGRKISSEDWDRAGLMSESIHEVAGVDISPDHLILKDVRTTTLKKILASYMALQNIGFDALEANLWESLKKFRDIASYIYRGTYPFTSLEGFESFRALAQQDLASAQSRLKLKKKGRAHAVVRVYYGPPGTGKTLTAVKKSVELIDPTYEGSDAAEYFDRFNENSKQCVFVTFHPSLQYDDLVESIRPSLTVLGDTAGEWSAPEEYVREPESQYRVHDGAFLKMARRALSDPSNEYVLLIDEINRGDVSRILGPLISALEPDKRIGSEFPIGVELLYPKAEELESRLYLPSNLHVVGTMNSSDRNIALVDHALRRRFEFVRVPPDPAMLRTIKEGDLEIDCRTLLEVINQRIEYLLDDDHVLGHGYLMGCKSISDVVSAFALKLIPLLKEYFFGNEGLVLLILNERDSESYCIFEKSASAGDFESLFGVPEDEAVSLGFRSIGSRKTLGFREEFWRSSELVSEPGDVEYAARAIMKIYGAP